VIRRLYSDLPKFKNLTFKKGFNLLLAEKSPGATDKQTRNGAGKSSLLEIVHFLLGSRCPKESMFRGEALRDATFGMEFDLGGEFTRVERVGASHGRVMVAGQSGRWPIAPTIKGEVSQLTNEHWKSVLAKMMFGLDDFSEAWSPKVRSLIGYFVRRDGSGGMAQPMMQSTKQQLFDQQVNISFLLGLDWSISRAWQAVREREKSLEQLKKGMRDGAFGAVVGSAASLTSELIVARDKLKRLRAGVVSFRVVEQYHDLEREASVLTRRLAEFADENLLDRRYLTELEVVTVEEVPPAPEDLDRLYKEAGVILPELVKKRFEDVALFHESVVRNRRAYLRSEIGITKTRMAERGIEMAKLDVRRAELMAVLKSAGALEHFMALQGELTKAETAAESLKQRHDVAEALETGDLKLKVERAQLVERLRQDYSEQSAAIEDAVLTFRNISSLLYEDDQAGVLTITPTANGPEFDPHMPAEKSTGVNGMRIFCFDMMLMVLSLQQKRSPGFLIHDSRLFDAVDERQKGKALAVGAELAERHGFQYIVTMNTDQVPKEVPSGFNLEDYAMDDRLTDAAEDGGLFGFRFD
jgi:uncharacterized protein YydD (DUF2326 family)